MILLIFSAVVSATTSSLERAFGVVGPLVKEYLSSENSFKLAWSHFIEINKSARAVTFEMQNVTATPGINSALADFYFINQERLDFLFSDLLCF